MWQYCTKNQKALRHGLSDFTIRKWKVFMDLKNILMLYVAVIFIPYCQMWWKIHIEILNRK